MTAQQFLFEYFLPISILLLVLYFGYKYIFSNKTTKNEQKANFAINTQAYERLILLLERCKFQNLFTRVSDQGLSASQYATALISEIRTELNHNITQQLYVQNISWQYINTALEQSIMLINAQNNSENSVSVFKNKLITQQLENQNQIIDLAISQLKSEFRGH